MTCKKRPKTKKTKPMVCVICKGNKKVRAQKKCCPAKMTSSAKGSWNI